MKNQWWKHRLARIASGLFLILAVAACTTLPDVRNLSSTLTPKATPTVTGSQGVLPATKAESILAKRLRNARIDAQALAALEEAATGSPLIAGNKVTLLYDGPETMQAMIAAISSATDSINLETYIFDQDELGQRFANLLIERQRAGVQVNIIYDSVGTLGTPAEFFERMRAAGIQLVEFNPINPFKRLAWWRLNHRDHRKILVVDGRIGFTGGLNITGDYSNSSLFRSRRKRTGAAVGWRDTHVQIEGPAVASLQWLFLDTWAQQRPNDLLQRDYFPHLNLAGDKIVRVLGSAPGGDPTIYKAYVLAIQEAKKTIHITTPYFVPDQQILDALKQAAQRGVEVKMLLPSVSDSKLVLNAGQSFYSDLLMSGIEVYQLQVAVLHAKTAVIDGSWSTVGSANLDLRSFLHNSEVNVIVLGTDFGQLMESAFQDDLRDARRITLDEWEQRPLGNRLKEWAARRLEYWL
ncbi:MAG TPA: cardiolipin synthase [Burkholderiaceae bacterium]|nr:cardiolipin synthase [Burkholderiaceae bacterium]